MGGTRIGGLRAAITNKKRYGDDFYKKLGKLGGMRKSPDKGFASQRVDKNGMTGSERASIAGRKGGQISKRRSD